MSPRQTLKEKRMNALNCLLKGACHYLLDYTYDSYYPCQIGECDICRCEILKNVRLNTPVVPEHLSNNLVRKIDIDTIYHYCLERLLTLHKVYDSSLWEFKIENGYYGQEVSGASFINTEALFKDINNIIDATDIDAIKYVLVKEYGYLLPSIEKCEEAFIKNIKLDKIIKNTNTYHKRIVDCEFYVDRELPIATCLGCSDHEWYNIVDGWHRYIAKIASNCQKHKIIILR